MITAVGGGGGGGEAAGLAGGSGGGGSQYYHKVELRVRAGGAGTEGQGFAGGAGNAALYAGGGGGAGGAGAAASTANPVGGDGRASDITGDPVYYAGGGGGGFCDKSFTGSHDPVAGGSGGGGSGGYGLNVPCTDATFYGGGGGGCGALAALSTAPGGSGYQGVVYVRVSIVAAGEIKKPVGLDVDFDEEEHVLVPANPAYTIVDLTEGSSTYGEVVESVSGTAAGTYRARVTLVDGFKWPDGTDDEVTATLTVRKATPTISNLAIPNWIYGTPGDETPNPGCAVSNAAAPTYWYGDSEAGPWSADKPTAVGTHYLRACVEGTDNYNAAEAVVGFEIANGPGDVYRDCVEITIDGASAPASDYIYALKLAESAPVGFLYSRAGATGDDMTVTDESGNVLDYRVGDWNTSGESTIYVKLPTLSTSAQVIRLFWGVRDGKTAPGHSSVVGPAGEAQPSCDFGLVARGGRRVNHWLTYPSLTKTKWSAGDVEQGAVESVGTLAYGTSALLYVTNLSTGATYSGMPTAGGAFRAVFGLHDPAGNYETPEYGIAFVFDGRVAYDDLSGDAGGLTQSGRVLLANDDSAPDGCAVTGQSYWQSDSTAYATYWEHTEDHYVNSADFPYLRPYAKHTLYAKDSEGNAVALWTLEDVVIGSTYAPGPAARSCDCYLPNSPTAKAISSETATAGLAEQGTMAMRNTKAAAILSPLYTNGVGTIYFDAVNADTSHADSGGYKLQVQVSVDGGVTFSPYKMKPFKREGSGAFAPDQTDTTELALEVSTGGTADSFYRVAVPVDACGNVRFRIVRTGTVDTLAEDSAFILVDNVIVSYSKPAASLVPYGEFVKDLPGRLVRGWGGAMTVPFPAAGENGVYARAKAVVDESAETPVAVDAPIAWAQMHYRWRYLDQLANDWQAVDLLPSGDGFVSAEPLDLPAEEGDVEFWYEYIAEFPTYRYHDYTGLGLGLDGADGNALYTEDVAFRTNRQSDVTGPAPLASCGTDWFFRLRRGESEWESFKLYVKDREDGDVRECDMTLAADHEWRGMLPMQGSGGDGMYVRVAGFNKQVPGDEEYALNAGRYSFADGIAALPATGTLSSSDNDDEWAWQMVPLDAKSGQMMVVLRDDTLEYAVLHAECQDFDSWTGACTTDGRGLFLGSFSGCGSADLSDPAVSATTFPSHFDNWNETMPTNKYWVETFPATKAELDSGAWPLYQPFDSAISPNTAFSIGPGQWVNGHYRDNSTGMALQMEGRGKGYIQLVDYAQSPRGLESVTFKARVAQSISFGDFAYYMTDPTSLTNYTFMTGAAFDINGRKDFAGNASLSLVALYTPGVGCYELRVEQDNAVVNAADAVTPGNTFRLSLYRWALDQELGEVAPTRLGTTTHSNGSNMFNTRSEDDGYARLFISVDTSVNGETRVVGGVARSSEARTSTAFFGSASYRYVAIRDVAANRLASGTYGLLSANCPARFVAPTYAATTVAYPTSNAGFRYGTYTVTPMAAAAQVSCKDDISNGKWFMAKSRMTAYKTSDMTWYGINAVIPSTTVDVYTAPAGTVKWELLRSQTVTGFGSASSAGATTTIPIYSLDACSVKVAAGGTFKTARIDVTVDDIEFRQFGGESYDDSGQDGVFDDTLYGSPTSIVFTQGQVRGCTDPAGEAYKACLLSAKRSHGDVATSIRSPLMADGDRGRGLGQLAFTYANAQSNAAIVVQIATNGLPLSSFASITESIDESLWTTVTNIDFSAMSEAERASGTVRAYLGLRGVKGAMRIALDPDTVAAVEDVMDPTAFGEVTITGVMFKDDPAAGDGPWRGCNMCTTFAGDKVSLGAVAGDLQAVGMSLGLNDSVSDEIREDGAQEEYTRRCPMLQTPMMAIDDVGEVSFRARLYDPADGCARVTLFGAPAADAGEEDWVKLAAWDVRGALYKPYSFSLPNGCPCKTFRLAVTGVDGVVNPMADDDPLVPPRRVLIDEVLVREFSEGWGGGPGDDPIEQPASALTLMPNSAKYGTVSGSGTYAHGEKVTINAKAGSGYVFAGWFTDKACTKPLNPKGYDNRNPTVKIVVSAKNTTIYAKFVSKAAAKKSLKFSSATMKLAQTAAKATAGKKFSLKLGISSASLVTVTATGLPKGLNIDKATGAITGTATVVGDFTATVTVKDAAGNKITQKVKITVRTASYAKGTFYGTAKPGKKGDPMAYLQFTVGSTGKVSGKVTYKGKAYSFKTTLSSCTSSKAAFTPKVKIGKKTFKPGAVTIRETESAGGRLVEAANSKRTFAAQKKANLVKKGKALAKLVGKSFTFTKKTKNSGLTKSGDKLKVKLADGDKVTASGTVNGKKLAALSAPLIVSEVSALDGMTTYTLYADILDAKTKYYKTVVFTVKVPVVLKPVPKVSARFARCVQK